MSPDPQNLSMDAQLITWALDELDKLGKRMHVSVAWGPENIPVPGQPGAFAPIPHWVMFITAPSPILGDPPLNAVKDLGYGEPSEAIVRKQVAEAVTAMNALGRDKLAQRNGHP